jgi:hypothetical protein
MILQVFFGKNFQRTCHAAARRMVLSQDSDYICQVSKPEGISSWQSMA